uniref:Uncharacterized protein n=1 Tax=Oryza barthii TaxID=65489 RepID=A0A0D3EXL8_9ORYZ
MEDVKWTSMEKKTGQTHRIKGRRKPKDETESYQIKQFYRYRGSEQKTGPAGRQKNTPHHSPAPPRVTVASRSE